MQDLAEFQQPSDFVDSDHPAVAAYAAAHTTLGASAIDNAVSLYYAIRDGFRYSPWDLSPTAAGFRASAVLQRDPNAGAHCIDKAVVLAACSRHVGIPARLHFANVRNHIGTEELERQLGSDVLVFHGYAELWLDERWVAATPAFNRGLCEKLGVDPLEFDGRSDSIFQAYDRVGGAFMEYLHDYGAFADIPFELMWAEWQRYYPKFAETGEWPRPERG